MKLAFISDIHANAYYLDTVWTTIQAHEPDLVYCLGDLIGYYCDPGEVVEWVRNNHIVAIKGNHEKYILNEITADAQRRELYKTDEHRRALNDEHIAFLSQLPEQIIAEHSGKKFFMTHSLPGDCETYLSDPNQLDREFLSDFDYYCFGHSHHPWLRVHFGTMLINPGSIGQPRDYTCQSSFAIVDLDKGQTILHKVAADVSFYSSKLLHSGIDESMVKILTRTRKDNGK